MTKFLLIILFLLCYFSLLLLLKNNFKVRVSLGIILFAILVNMNFKAFIFKGEIVYSNVATLLIFLIVVSLQFHFLLIKYKNKNQFTESFSKVTVILFSFIFISLLIWLQMYVRNIYNFNLFFYHLWVYITLALLLLWFYYSSKMQEHISNIYLFKSAIAISIINFIISALQYIFNKSFLPSNPNSNINYYEGVEVVKRVWGIVGASNGAGNLGAILFPILLYYLYKSRSSIALISFVMNILFVLLTLTRIAYVAIIIETFIFIYFVFFRNLTYKNLSIRIFIILLGFLFFLLMTYLYFDDVYKLLVVDRGNTENHRFVQFDTAIELIKSAPLLGVGAGQYERYLYSNFGIRDIVVHSQFLNIFVETGLFSFAIFLFVYIYIGILLLRRFPRDRWFPLSLFIGNFITINFNPNQYYSINIYLFMFFSLGLIFYDNYLDNKDTKC